MIIACFKGNPSNEFYKHISAKYIKDGVYKRLNLTENIWNIEIYGILYGSSVNGSYTFFIICLAVSSSMPTTILEAYNVSLTAVPCDKNSGLLTI